MPQADRGADIYTHDHRPGADHPNLDSFVEHDGAVLYDEHAASIAERYPLPFDLPAPFVHVGPTLAERVTDYLNRQREAILDDLDARVARLLVPLDEPAVQWHVDYCREGCPCH